MLLHPDCAPRYLILERLTPGEGGLADRGNTAADYDLAKAQASIECILANCFNRLTVVCLWGYNVGISTSPHTSNYVVCFVRRSFVFQALGFNWLIGFGRVCQALNLARRGQMPP